MTPAAAAAEYKSNIGFDYSLADFTDEDETPEPPEDETAARQALNQVMFEFLYS